MEVTVYTVNACHQTYCLVPSSVLSNNCRSSPVLPAMLLLLPGATKRLSASWCVVMDASSSFPTRLASWSVTGSRGRGCLLFHIWVSTIDFWGEAFFSPPKLKNAGPSNIFSYCQIQQGIKLLMRIVLQAVLTASSIGKWRVSPAASIRESAGLVVLADPKKDPLGHIGNWQEDGMAWSLLALYWSHLRRCWTRSLWAQSLC